MQSYSKKHGCQKAKEKLDISKNRNTCSHQLTNFKCTKVERAYGLASFNRAIYYHVPRYILKCTPHRIVVCSKQRVRLLLGELHNLILFRVAAAANISLRDCSRELTRLTRKISGSDELRRDSQNLALNSRITLVVRSRRLDDGHIRCTKTRCRKIRYQFLAYRDVPSLPNKDPFIRSDGP